MQKYSINLAVVGGRLGAEPEVRYATSGLVITNISLATTESVKKNDAYVDETEWHRVVIFGKTAEFTRDYIHKGDLVLVKGRISTSSWEDRDGVKRYKTEIVAETVTPLAKAGQGSARRDEAPPMSQDPVYQSPHSPIFDKPGVEPF